MDNFNTKFELFKPNLSHIKQMQELVLSDVENGNILPRDENEMATNIRSYVAIKDKETNIIIGFVALHIYTTTLAEIRSLIVHSDFRGIGIAKKLINHCVDEGRKLTVKKLLVLTYKQKLFEAFGFEVILKESIPETKIWADCIKCKHFPICDEISLTLDI
ncbi:MAG: N-acetyltransferase [Campylobacterota bacterium]|nr:N-acetyltransferase [Campylobacterota bacterium]